MGNQTLANTPLDREALDRLLRPERIALVGASDKNLFSRRAFAQHHRVAAAKQLTLVNPRSRQVHGVHTVPTCGDIDGGIDCAFLMTPQHATGEALIDAAAGGAKAAAVLGQGWAEEGSEGLQRQEELVALAEELGVVLLGPNHLGFANLWDGVAPCALGLDMPVEPGAFALVSQSGAVGSSMVGYAGRQDVRFSFVVTTGNEAMVTVADVVRYLVEDEHTRAIGIFAETIRKPAVFRAAARRAAELGKALIILKAGSSELAAQTAQAHTGALVGDDRVIDAVLRQDGVIRVRSVEDLICTGMLCAGTGPLRASGVGVMSVSGGACDLIADRGQDVGLRLPPLSSATKDQLAQVLPAYGHPQNPLDVTGSAATRPEVWRSAFELLAAEPTIGLIGAVTSLPTPGEPQRDDTFHAVGAAIRATGVPGVIFPQIDQIQNDHVREVKSASGVDIVLPSVERFALAAAGLGRWSDWLRTRPGRPAASSASHGDITLPGSGPLSELAGRDLLERAGIPAVPATLATSTDDAVAAAVRLGEPVALKMCSAQVAHKTELGGVELGVSGTAAVAAAYERLAARAQAAGVELDGVLVSPMRTGGVELLVGVTHDPDWGPVLAVAVGGALVELLDDSALRVLPVGPDEVRSMFEELRGYKLLTGFRGSKPADIDGLVDVVLRLSELALALGPSVESVEINPLLVDGDRIEALDVLVTRSVPS
ncbi:acetate--CoA ligase family protein (plasmid) [Rhodococcus opacus]|uniref:acetate--CoA ligase family protein n=1 Tax=Rhodococcus opacus TaxID=37919 RepID=UPI0034D1DF0C